VGGALTDAVWIFAVVLALIVLAAAALAARRYLLERSGGTVECGLRLASRANWRLGVLSYQRDELCWFGALGVLLRPDQVFHRRALAVVARRPADLAEAAALGADRIIVEVSTGGDAHVELAMTEEALTGFLAWLEASPPGSHLSDIALQKPGSSRTNAQLRHPPPPTPDRPPPHPGPGSTAPPAPHASSIPRRKDLGSSGAPWPWRATVSVVIPANWDRVLTGRRRDARGYLRCRCSRSGRG
jgi:Protein of unknown function (DUF2550)